MTRNQVQHKFSLPYDSRLDTLTKSCNRIVLKELVKRVVEGDFRICKNWLVGVEGHCMVGMSPLQVWMLQPVQLRNLTSKREHALELGNNKKWSRARPHDFKYGKTFGYISLG